MRQPETCTPIHSHILGGADCAELKQREMVFVEHTVKYVDGW